LAEFRRFFAEEGLERGVNYVERAIVEGPNHSERIDFAITNGRAIQLTQTWNFRKRNLEAVTEAVKAWAWTINDIRSGGGRGRAKGTNFEVPRDVAVDAVYVPPTSQQGRDSFAEARHAFVEVDANVVAASEAHRVATRAARALARAHRR
jgi:hypothetical protein